MNKAMDIDTVDRQFSEFLLKSWAPGELAPFLLSCIRILSVFEDELSRAEVEALKRRQKQIRNGRPMEDAFDDLRVDLRKRVDNSLETSEIDYRRNALNRLLFATFLDSEEPDSFYLSEPIFAFARNMGMDPQQLRKILESEFRDFS